MLAAGINAIIHSDARHCTRFPLSYSNSIERGNAMHYRAKAAKHVSWTTCLSDIPMGAVLSFQKENWRQARLREGLFKSSYIYMIIII